VEIGLVALLIAVAVGVLLSVLKSRYDGRFRTVHRHIVHLPAGHAAAGHPAGGRGGGKHTAERASSEHTGDGHTGDGHTGDGHTGDGHTSDGHTGDGHMSGGPTPPAAEPKEPLPDDIELGERATLVQFSSTFCAPCRATHRILADVAGMIDGVRHVEIDAEANLDLVRRLDILRTPTVLVLDADGELVTRASGQPRKADVIAAVGRAVDHPSHARSA
jgi:thiol-disulfide isomerase/thioredoxin